MYNPQSGATNPTSLQWAQDVFAIAADGQTAVGTTSNTPVLTAEHHLFVNGVHYVRGTHYTVDLAGNIVWLDTPMTLENADEVVFSYYFTP